MVDTLAKRQAEKDVETLLTHLQRWRLKRWTTHWPMWRLMQN